MKSILTELYYNTLGKCFRLLFCLWNTTIVVILWSLFSSYGENVHILLKKHIDTYSLVLKKYHQATIITCL